MRRRYYENTKNPDCNCNKRSFFILSEIPSVYGNMDVFLYTRRCMYSYTKKGSFRSGHCPGAGIYAGCSEKIILIVSRIGGVNQYDEKRFGKKPRGRFVKYLRDYVGGETGRGREIRLLNFRFL